MAEKHFNEQRKFTKTYLLSLFQKHIPDFKNSKILEIGCAEAGFLDVLHDMNIEATGLELEPERVKTSRKKNPHLKVLEGDITDQNIVDKVGESFDLIVMRDVIEHIPDRRTSFLNISKLLKKNGYLYVSFPPKFSGFAGHQQNAKSILRFVPFLQLLPENIIKVLGKIFKENSKLIEAVIDNYRIGLTIKTFEKISRKFNFYPVQKDLFLFRPIYKIRFNVSPIKIPNIPFIREFLAFGYECLLQKDD
jgi:2-polyprenyl-3-methyl-5-hydroxy-6-metoxy-1,4-benzoquinol methylase